MGLLKIRLLVVVRIHLAQERHMMQAVVNMAMNV